MYKKILSIFLISIIVGVAGCTINPETQSTFGEKEPVSVDYLHIINSTSEYSVENGINTYYIYGYIGNNAEYNALNVEIYANFFDKNNKLIGTNKSAFIKPKIIPTKGESYYCLTFKDPEQTIVRCELKPVVKY